MVKSFVFTIVLMALFSNYSFAQNAYTSSIKFSYDDAGNRIKRQEIRLFQPSPGYKQSETRVARDSLGSLAVSVFPNPTLGHLTISMDGSTPTTDLTTIFLFDYTGRLIVQKQQVQGSSDLDLSSYPAGIYTLKLSSGENKCQWQIIKE